MTAFGPTLAGGSSANNTVSLSFKPSVDIPAGSYLWVPGITNSPDSANISCSDASSNSYTLQTFVQPPGSTFAIALFTSLLTQPLLHTQNITIATDTRAQWAAGLVFYGGARGVINSIGTQFVDTSTHPVFTCPVRANQTLLAMVVVGGPNTDIFTQDPNYSADIGAGLGTTSFAIHGGGSASSPAITDLATATYAPVLGTARQSIGFIAAFT